MWPDFITHIPGAGTFGTVRAGIYKPKNGGPAVECAIKVLKPADELPNQKVCVESSLVLSLLTLVFPPS